MISYSILSTHVINVPKTKQKESNSNVTQFSTIQLAIDNRVKNPPTVHSKSNP